MGVRIVPYLNELEFSEFWATTNSILTATLTVSYGDFYTCASYSRPDGPAWVRAECWFASVRIARKHEIKTTARDADQRLSGLAR